MIPSIYKKNNPLFRASCLYSISLQARLLLLVLTIPLTSCFSSSSNPPVEIPLEHELSTLSVEQIGKDPLLYKVAIPSVPVPVFATGLEECGVKDFVPSKATTRQLLVGFSNIKVNAQTLSSAAEGSVLQSDISATVDDEPITLFTFTKRNQDCVRDVAFWYRTSESNTETAAQIKESLLTNFHLDRVQE